MRKILLGFLLTVGLITHVSAAIRGDVKVLEATDTIRSVADSLAREYMLYALFPQKRFARENLDDELEELPKSFQEIAGATKDERTKGLLTFFTYQKARADGIVQEPKPTRKLAEEMLEMSRSFVEGSENIARHHTYNFSPEEKMFMLTRSMQRHLASLAKYYVARKLFPDDPALTRQIASDKKRFEMELKKINAYRYKDPEVLAARKTLNAIWKTTLPYWETKTPDKAMPMLLSVATNQMIDLLDTLGAYHSKNQ